MPAALPRPEIAIPAGSAARLIAAPQAHAAPASSSSVARLADERAIPAPSPVHQLQAELAKLTAAASLEAEPLYPGWFRLGFPVAASALLWAWIVWGVTRLI